MSTEPTPTQRVILLRHGQTDWSASGQHTGRTDIPLTDLGRQQAKATHELIERLALVDPYVLSSPRQRATDTAKLAGLPIAAITDELSEWDYGAYEGMTTEQIRELAPGWTVWTQRCPGGETAEQVRQRADNILTAAAERPTHSDVVLVGHGHFSRALLARWVALPVTAGIHFGMSPAGVAVMGHEHGRRQISALNLTG